MTTTHHPTATRHRTAAGVVGPVALLILVTVVAAFIWRTWPGDTDPLLGIAMFAFGAVGYAVLTGDWNPPGPGETRD